MTKLIFLYNGKNDYLINSNIIENHPFKRNELGPFYHTTCKEKFQTN